MRTKLSLVGLFLLGYLLVGIIVSDPNYEVATQSQPQMRTNLGMPAIVPSLSSTELGASRFTIADVQAYLNKHPFLTGLTVSGNAPTIHSIEFITSKEASMRMHGEQTGLPDMTLVCYVELYGPFTMSNVVVPPHAKPLPIMNITVEVFDAQTGNLLMTWSH